MPGPRPKPTALKVIEGNPSRRPLNTAEPAYGPLGGAPDDLCDVARAKWSEMVREWRLVLTSADRDQLAEYCRLDARKRQAEEKVAEHGPVVASPNGFPVQSPWLQIVNKCREDMRKIAVEFGGTPASRTRVKATDKPPESKFGNLLTG